MAIQIATTDTPTYRLSTGDAFAGSRTKFSIPWAMVSVPVKIGSLTDAKTSTIPGRSGFIKTDDGEYHPIGQAKYDTTVPPKTEDGYTWVRTVATLPEGHSVVQRTQASTGEWVELTDDEIEGALTGYEKGVADLRAFVPADQFDRNYIPAGVPFVWAAQDDRLPTVEAYSLLRAVLTARDLVCLVYVGDRWGGKMYGLRGDGTGVALQWAEFSRVTPEIKTLPVPDEYIEMGARLVDMVGVSCPVLVNEAHSKIVDLVDAKADGTTITPSKTVMAAKPEMSLFAALEASLAAAEAAA